MGFIKSLPTACLGILLAVAIPAVAQKDYSPETIPNVRLKDAGNHVCNPDSVLSELYADSINMVLNALEDSMGTEVAVVAVRSIGDNEPRMFATELFNKWGLGKKGKDNGLLILLVTDPEQRAVVFETGYGIEGVLPDILCARIQRDHMVPRMKDGDYSRGMLEGVKAAAEVLVLDEPYKEAASDDELSVFDLVMYLMLFFVIFIIVAPFVLSWYKKHHPLKCPKCGQKTLMFEKTEVVTKPTRVRNGLEVDTFVCKNCGHVEEKKTKLPKVTGRSSSGRDRFSDDDRSRGGRHSSGGSWGGGSSGGGGSITRF